jgi:hypothetical protein
VGEPFDARCRGESRDGSWPAGAGWSQRRRSCRLLVASEMDGLFVGALGFISCSLAGRFNGDLKTERRGSSVGELVGRLEGRGAGLPSRKVRRLVRGD